MTESTVESTLAELTSSPTPEVEPGLIKRIFLNQFGHWRAGWRLLFYVLAAAAIGISMRFLRRLALPDLTDAPLLSWTNTIGWFLGIFILTLSALIILKWVDRRPLSLLGLGFGRGWVRELLIGIAAGILLTGSVVLVLVVTGSVRLGLSADLGQSLAAIPFYLVLFTLAGTVEELMFRGYPLQVLAEGSRRWIAAGLLCLLFTAGHLGNPDVSIIGILNIFLIGIFLAITYFKTLRLWIPVGLHLSWNFCQSWLWGFDVSGIKIDNTLFEMKAIGPAYLTGGGFGLEGSAVSIAVVLLVTMWLLRTKAVKPTEEMAALWSVYPSGFRLAPVGEQAEGDTDQSLG